MRTEKGGRALVAATVVEAELLTRGLKLPPQPWEEQSGSLLRRFEGDLPFLLVVTGMGPQRAKEGLENALRRIEGIRALVGFGLAGGLVKESKRGDLVIPTKVRWGSDSEMPTEWLRMALSAHGEGTIWRNLLTVSEVVSSRAEKAALYAATDADAVDMESGCWGAIARQAKIPWGIVRGVLDPADQTIPPGLAGSVDPFGRISLARTVPFFLRHPGQIGPALRLSGAALETASAPMVRLLASWLRSER